MLNDKNTNQGKTLGQALTAAGKDKEPKEEKQSEVKKRLEKLESEVRIINATITMINKNLNSSKAPKKGRSLADALNDGDI